MQNTMNVFTDGLTTDLNPLTTKNNLLTDALNATFRTFNGNELLLQNDMGNTMILDSTTGNIMGLRDGFIPIGMKEYGGILYIASYNQKTNEGELGTIPSPVFNYDYIDDPYENIFNKTLTNIDENNSSTSLLPNASISKYFKTSFQLSDKRFEVGDQFIVCLHFDNYCTIKRTCAYVKNLNTSYNSLINSTFKTFPESSGLYTRQYSLFTGFKKDRSSNDIIDYGWFKILLEAKVEKSDLTIPLNNIVNQRLIYYLESELDALESNYWFIAETDENNLSKKIDSDRCEADLRYRAYPNILPGYLYVRLEPELPNTNLENIILPRNVRTKQHSPNMYLIEIEN